MNEMTVSPKSCCESMNSFVRIYNYLNVLSERCGRKMKIYIFKIECKRICRINFFCDLSIFKAYYLCHNEIFITYI